MRLFNKFLSRKLLNPPVFFSLLCLFLAAAASCNLIFLSDISILVWPEEKDGLVAEGAELWAEFSIEPDKISAESLAFIKGGDLRHELDFRWEGRRMYMKPVPALTPGIRYTVSLSGTLETLSRGRFQVQQVSSFFSVSKAPLLSLVSSFPAEGGDAAEKTPLLFSFSRPVDRNTFKAGFSLTPRTEYDIEFLNENTSIKVAPKEAWDYFVSYTWTLSRDICDLQGVPLTNDISGGFIVQEDKTAPVLLSFAPAFFSGGYWMPLPGVGKRDGLLFTFSEDPDLESLVSAFSIKPWVRGIFRRAKEGAAVFMPEEDFLMNTEYALSISRELKDRAGNHLAKEFFTTFTPDIPLQEVVDIRLISGNEDHAVVVSGPSGFCSYPPVETTVAGAEPDLYLVVSIRFSEAYESPYREDITRRIGLKSFFPPGLTDPALVSVVWDSFNKTATFQYEGFEKSEPPNPPFSPPSVDALYKLLVPGGKGLSENQNGSFLEEDVWILIKIME